MVTTSTPSSQIGQVVRDIGTLAARRPPLTLILNFVASGQLPSLAKLAEAISEMVSIPYCSEGSLSVRTAIR